jgi:CO dehydrogenase maturation factor
VDWLLVVVEPGRRSVETAHQVQKLARDLGLTKLAVVGNKVRSESDKEFLQKHITDLPILGFLPFDEKVIEADLKGRPPYETSPTLLNAAQEIGKKLGGG